MISWYCHRVDGIILFLTLCQFVLEPLVQHWEKLPVWSLLNWISLILSCQTCKLTRSLHAGARKWALRVRLLYICGCAPNRGLCRSAETCLDHGVHDGKHGCTWLDLSCYCMLLHVIGNIDLVTTRDCCVSQESRSCSCNMVFWCFLDSSRSLKFTLQQTRSREGNSCLQYTSQRTSSDMGIWVCLKIGYSIPLHNHYFPVIFLRKSKNWPDCTSFSIAPSATQRRLSVDSAGNSADNPMYCCEPQELPVRSCKWIPGSCQKHHKYAMWIHVSWGCQSMIYHEISTDSPATQDIHHADMSEMSGVLGNDRYW